MILDLEKFIREESPGWSELEQILDRIEEDPALKLSLKEVRRLHYLYQRASAGLSRIQGLSSEPEIRRFLENLVSRSFGEIHESRHRAQPFKPWTWFVKHFPRTYRRHMWPFALSVAALAIGAFFGAGAMAIDPGAKEVLIPFAHLSGDPSEHVAGEERSEGDEMKGAKIRFSSHLMTHNTRIAVLCMAMGLTFGIGTVVLLFYNGAILGAVALDYVRAGQSAFLLGWLMPHGVVEIPAILISGQVGLILAGAMLGREDGRPLGDRFRSVSADAVTLIFGAAVLLAWAGIVEAFLSQYHQPVLPYTLKIGFGILELGALVFLLAWSGSRSGAKT